MLLPRLIHFIWAGGDNIMPPESRVAVTKWAKQNPTFQVIIWIDIKTTSLDALKLYFKRNFLTPCPLGEKNITLCDITTETWFTTLDNLEKEYSRIRAATEDKNTQSRLVSPCVRYELNRFDPNYGRSSDVLRYKILHAHGGGYFDSDISPGKKNLEFLYEHFATQINHELLLIGEKSQNTNSIANDIFVSSPNHPMMQELAQIAEARYHMNDAYWRTYPDQLIYIDRYSVVTISKRKDLSAIVENRTLNTTGPEIVKQLCFTKNMMDVGNPHRTLSPVSAHSLSVDYYQPFPKNTLSWMKAKENHAEFLKSGGDEQAVIQRVFSTIVFEAKLGFIRFDDHVFFIMHTLDLLKTGLNKEPCAIERRIANQLLEMIMYHVDTHNIVFAQCITRHRCFFEYWKRLPHLNLTADQENLSELLMPYKTENSYKKISAQLLLEIKTYLEEKNSLRLTTTEKKLCVN